MLLRAAKQQQQLVLHHPEDCAAGAALPERDYHGYVKTTRNHLQLLYRAGADRPLPAASYVFVDGACECPCAAVAHRKGETLVVESGVCKRDAASDYAKYLTLYECLRGGARELFVVERGGDPCLMLVDYAAGRALVSRPFPRHAELQEVSVSLTAGYCRMFSVAGAGPRAGEHKATDDGLASALTALQKELYRVSTHVRTWHGLGLGGASPLKFGWTHVADAGDAFYMAKVLPVGSGGDAAAGGAELAKELCVRLGARLFFTDDWIVRAAPQIPGLVDALRRCLPDGCTLAFARRSCNFVLLDPAGCSITVPVGPDAQWPLAKDLPQKHATYLAIQGSPRGGGVAGPGRPQAVDLSAAELEVVRALQRSDAVLALQRVLRSSSSATATPTKRKGVPAPAAAAHAAAAPAAPPAAKKRKRDDAAAAAAASVPPVKHQRKVDPPSTPPASVAALAAHPFGASPVAAAPAKSPLKTVAASAEARGLDEVLDPDYAARSTWAVLPVKGGGFLTVTHGLPVEVVVRLPDATERVFPLTVSTASRFPPGPAVVLYEPAGPCYMTWTAGHPVRITTLEVDGSTNEKTFPVKAAAAGARQPSA